jgi:cytochrome P450
MYELSHYPEAWAKLRAETMEVVGPDREPTYEHLRNLKYLQRTLNETLRLFPAVPFNVRYALQDTSLPSPVPGEPAISVLKGDAVFYSTMSMQRREDLYPPTTPEFAKPSIFSPERWEHWQPRPWEYIPFNGGPRICIGQSFALTELAYVLVRLVQRFERVEYRGDWAAQYHKVDLVGVPGQGVPIALWEAKREEGA